MHHRPLTSQSGHGRRHCPLMSRQSDHRRRRSAAALGIVFIHLPEASDSKLILVVFQCLSQRTEREIEREREMWCRWCQGLETTPCAHPPCKAQRRCLESPLILVAVAPDSLPRFRGERVAAVRGSGQSPRIPRKAYRGGAGFQTIFPDSGGLDRGSWHPGVPNFSPGDFSLIGRTPATYG